MTPDQKKPLTMKEEEVLYDNYFQAAVIDSRSVRAFNSGPPGLRELPRYSNGQINWTAAVVQGLLAPNGSLRADVEEDKPYNLNIFIKAITPLMSDVVFPHSIHTYWLSCNNCHPKIFIPMAGANPISMEEIFKGEWCGQCHGKVAFDFWPDGNCRRCHMAPKGT